MKGLISGILPTFVGTVVFASTAAGATQAPFREPLSSSILEKPVVVYARVDDHGVGVQFHKDPAVKPAALGTVGFLLIGFTGAAMGGFANASMLVAPQLTIDNSDALIQVSHQADAQRDLERSLLRSLSASVFSHPVQVRTLAPGASTLSSSFAEDPVLIVDVYPSLTSSYRSLQITALAYVLSRSKLRADSAANKTGRLYLNRFDYISEPLPEPVVLPKEERKAKLQALRIQYSGQLTNEELKAKKEAKRRLDGTMSPFAEGAAELLDTWMAADGALLRRELTLGTERIAELLARDLKDASTFEVSSDETRQVQVIEDIDHRVTVRYLAGVFSGALISQPTALDESTCTNITFSEKLSDQDTPDLCAGRNLHPGAACAEGYGDIGGGCRQIKSIKKRKQRTVEQHGVD